MPPQSTPFPLPSDIGLKLGDSGERVALLNASLANMGYCNPKVGESDHFTAETASGMRAYQAANHMHVTGFLSEEAFRDLARSRCGIYDLPRDLDLIDLHRVRECVSKGNPWGRLKLTYSVIKPTSDLETNLLTQAVEQAFAIWRDAVEGLDFEPGDHNADIRISFYHGEAHDNKKDHERFSNDLKVLAHASDPYIDICKFDDANLPNSRGDIHINDFTDWKDGEYDLTTVLAHEIGHVLGLGHSPQENSIMYHAYTQVYTELSSDERDLLHQIYIEKRPLHITKGWIDRGGGKGHIGLVSFKLA